MASPDTDYVVGMVLPSLETIAKNTAQTRDAVMGIGGASGSAAAAPAMKEKKSDDSWIDRQSKMLEQTIGSAIGHRLAQAQGLANRGFQGTVEQMRMDFAMDQLGRQFAAVMMPLMQGMTYLAEQIEVRMRRMNGNEQNRLLGAGIGAAVGLRYGGVPGAIAGAAAGSLLMPGGGRGPYDSYMAMGTGAYLGFRVGGLPGAAAGATAGYVAERGDYGMMTRAGMSGPMAAATATAFAGVDAASWLMSPFGVTNPLDERRRRWAEGAALDPAKAAPRRDVTPYRYEVGEAGSSSWRIQEGVMKATGAGGNDGGPLKPIIDMLVMCVDNLGKLVKISGGTPAAPPASGAG